MKLNFTASYNSSVFGSYLILIFFSFLSMTLYLMAGRNRQKQSQILKKNQKSLQAVFSIQRFLIVKNYFQHATAISEVKYALKISI